MKQKKLIELGIKSNKYKAPMSVITCGGKTKAWVELLEVWAEFDTANNTSETILYPSIDGVHAPLTPDTNESKIIAMFNMEALEYVAKSMSKDSTRYLMNGIYFNHEREEVVATDGHRLHAAAITNHSEFKPVILPSAMIEAIVKCKDRTDNNRLSLLQSGTYYGISGYGWTVWGKAIQGDYPDYVQVIPEAKKLQEINVPSDYPDLITGCKIEHATIYPDRIEYEHVLKDSTNTASLALKGIKVVDGVVSSVYPWDTDLRTKPIRINLRYLKDSKLDCKQSIYVTGDYAPIFIRNIGGTMCSVLMPMRIV